MKNITTTREFTNSLTPELKAKEVEKKFENLDENLRLNLWKHELDTLIEEKKLSLPELAEFVGLSRSEHPRFYTGLPKKKETYVKIGLILKQPKETVNRWITKNTKSNMLYARDPKDLIGIYFLHQNMKGKRSSKYYCDIYSDCLKYLKENNSNKDDLDEKIDPYKTIEIERMIEGLDKPEECIRFIQDNGSTFHHTNERVRTYINNYIEILLESLNRTKRKSDKKWSALQLKENGVISPAQYNYLTGSNQTLKKKSSLISIALDLGMSEAQINELLHLGGFDSLNINDDSGFAEIALIYLLRKWEQENHLVRSWRNKYILHNQVGVTREYTAVRQLLKMREDIIKEFNEKFDGYTFPF